MSSNKQIGESGFVDWFMQFKKDNQGENFTEEDAEKFYREESIAFDLRNE